VPGTVPLALAWRCGLAGCSLAILTLFCLLRVGWSAEPKKLDPAAWGGDHVGKPVPEFETANECLFCHRNDVGPAWSGNRHNQTIRSIDEKSPALAALKELPDFKKLPGSVEFVIGRDNRQRFLKPGADYGTLEMLSVSWAPPQKDREAKLVSPEKPHWDAKDFGKGCAGCHATGVNSDKRTFALKSLDCFVCHGEVPEKHTKEKGLVYLGSKRADPARVVTSACAQCHLRNGKSKSSGLPYPNNFVAGDNLFRDFQVDFSDEAIAKLNPADRHIVANVRDVAVLGKEEVTCLSCHEIHKASSKKHHRVAESRICLDCHNAEGPKTVRKSYEVHSAVCGY
jgi:predicted CXXCH cytochrome family protein